MLSLHLGNYFQSLNIVKILLGDLKVRARREGLLISNGTEMRLLISNGDVSC